MRTYSKIGLAMLLLVSCASTSFAQKRGTSDSRRMFYLTQHEPNGAEVLTACDDGFHTASMWEILDASNLKYDTTRGRMKPDSGFGPPIEEYGFIRTGGNYHAGSFEGANCQGWTRSDFEGRGTVVSLEWSWTDSTGSIRTGPWRPALMPCHNPSEAGVWCVQD
jgi:hypothetical protein